MIAPEPVEVVERRIAAGRRVLQQLQAATPLPSESRDDAVLRHVACDDVESKLKLPPAAPLPDGYADDDVVHSPPNVEPSESVTSADGMLSRYLIGRQRRGKRPLGRVRRGGIA